MQSKSNHLLPLLPKTSIAVVSPFLDKRHGTERCVAEQVERLARDYEVHVYSNRVEDINLSRIAWHRVPALPGPHLFAYCWWFIANHLWRSWDRIARGRKFALTYTPGINCLNADVISIHIIFAEFRLRVRDSLRLTANPLRAWPQLVHRRIYYRLMATLEGVIYGEGNSMLTVVSSQAGRHLDRYGRNPSQFAVIPHGIDPEKFCVDRRQKLRASARAELGISESDFCLLLVGNDWKNKGLPCLLEGLGRLANPYVELLVVGQDVAEPYRSALRRLRLEDRVRFLPLRRDVEFYYAAADLYVGPSLEDAFGMPPLEAMACGVPSIVSSQAGVSEVITEGVDGFILADPHDSRRLAQLIELVYNNNDLREKMGEAAAKTAQKYTWDKNAAQLDQLFQEVLRRKGLNTADVAADQSTR